MAKKVFEFGCKDTKKNFYTQRKVMNFFRFR